MQAAVLSAFGKASEVLTVADRPEPEPGPAELLLEMLLAPVNPADLNIIEGKYGERPTLPATIGNEGVGRVMALGEGVAGFSEGDLVLPMTRGTWARRMKVSAHSAIRLPGNIDPRQASMLSVNPPSAWAMLENFVALQPGEWVALNAANSAVGRSVIQIAKARGWKSLSVVRRPELVEELKALGGDVVVLEEVDLRTEVANFCGADRPRLALNAVGGASALNLANALADGGCHITYGAMGRQPLKLPNGLLIFKNLSFQGFWLRKWHDSTSRAEKERVLTALAELSLQGRLQMPVHRIFPLGELAKAIPAAAGEARAGKVLLDLQS